MINIIGEPYLVFKDNSIELCNDRWITIHPNGEDNKGKPLLVKDGETPSEAVKRVYGKSETAKKDMSEWSQQFRQLDYSQREALHDYFSAENQNINSYLRQGASDEWSEGYTRRIEKRIDKIDSAMKELPSNMDLIRMVKKDDAMKLLDVNKLDESIIGKSFVQRGYTSTTYDEGSSIFDIYHDTNKYIRLNLHVGKDVKGVAMEQALVDNNYDESDYESMDIRNEKEILLQRGLSLKVTNVTKKDQEIVISCDVGV